LGETIPEKTGLDVGADTTVNLVHFGTNSEVTLPAGARVTVLMNSIEGLASGTSQAKLEEMPQGLDLEARHQQQVGAVNMQHMAQAAPQKVLRAKAEIRPAPEPSGSGPAAPPPPPTPVVMPAPAPVTAPDMSEAMDVQKRIGLTRGGKFNKGADIIDFEEGASAREQANAALEAKIALEEKFDASSALMRTVSIALPVTRLTDRLGRLETLTISRVPQSFTSRDIADEPGVSTGTWALADVRLLGGDSQADVRLTGPDKREAALTVAFLEDADVSVSTAVRLEFRGFPAQAAAVWIELLKREAVSTEIAAAHLRRLAAAIVAKLH
ncbi:MAG TPA: hypothetical protein PLY73_09160, partial [Candidatus Ozemobacteraceae bacterium]|nr:hypothetical protein [Candidatus Ozemobacteraceae bacterium]